MLDVVLSTVERGVVQSQPEHAVPAADVPPCAQLELQVELLSVSQAPTAVPQLADSAVVKPELWALARLVRRVRNSPSAGRSRSAARRAMIIKCMMSVVVAGTEEQTPSRERTLQVRAYVGVTLARALKAQVK